MDRPTAANILRDIAITRTRAVPEDIAEAVGAALATIAELAADLATLTDPDVPDADRAAVVDQHRATRAAALAAWPPSRSLTSTSPPRR